jgi:hypothetical protein
MLGQRGCDQSANKTRTHAGLKRINRNNGISYDVGLVRLCSAATMRVLLPHAYGRHSLLGTPILAQNQ